MLDPNHKISQENLEQFGEDIKACVKDHIETYGSDEGNYLRMSNLGRKDRRLKFDLEDPDPPNATLGLTFLLGHVIEQVYLLLAKEAGHTVEHCQRETNIDGVLGHMDAVIDGIPTDIKSHSPYQAYKFVSHNKLRENDEFGYITQLGGYREWCVSEGLTESEHAAIWPINKSSGYAEPLIFHAMDFTPTPDRIKHVREMLDSPRLPPICWEPVDSGKSGNKELHKNCKFCRHKKSTCFPNLRVFEYAQGPKFFTEVKRLPSKPEITDVFFKDAEEKANSGEE